MPLETIPTTCSNWSTITVDVHNLFVNDPCLCLPRSWRPCLKPNVRLLRCGSCEKRRMHCCWLQCMQWLGYGSDCRTCGSCRAGGLRMWSSALCSCPQEKAMKHHCKR